MAWNSWDQACSHGSLQPSADSEREQPSCLSAAISSIATLTVDASARRAAARRIDWPTLAFAGGAERAGAGRSWRLPVDRALLLLGTLGALAYLIENGLQQWSALHLETTLHASPMVSGLAPGLLSGSLAAGRLLAQRYARLIGDIRLIALAGGSSAAGAGLGLSWWRQTLSSSCSGSPQPAWGSLRRPPH